MNKRTALVLLALAAVASLVAAQDTTLAVDRIVVTATRIAGTILDSPDHVTVVSGEELATALSAAEALERVAGVSIADSGTAGSVQSVSIRGSTSAQVLVLVDGVRLNDNRQGAPDLSQIPVDNIERIEIVRGGTSALYGADAVAGVVNIITKTRAEKPFSLSVQNGSYIPRAAVEAHEDLPAATITSVTADPLALVDTQKVAAQFSTALGDADLLLRGSFTRAANQFVWKDEQYVDAYRRRSNAELLGAEGFLSFVMPVGTGQLGLKGQAGYQEVGAPGSIDTARSLFGYGYLFSTDSRQQRATFQGLLSYTSPRFLSPLLTLDAKLFYKFSRLDFQNPNPIDISETAVDDSHILNSVGLDLMQQVMAFDFLQIVYGGNLLLDYADSTQIGLKERISGGAFIEAPLYLLSWLTITPMLRYDLYSDFPDSLNYKLSAVLALSERISLKASGARSYRAPTLNDLYWDQPSFGMFGNPDLRPEIGYNVELGVTMVDERIQFNFFAFVRYVQDGIQWAFTTVFQPVNIGEALYPGFETDLQLTIFKGFSLSAAYTFLYSYVLNASGTIYSLADDRRAAYAPVHSLDAGLKLDIGNTMLSVNAQYIGQRYNDVEGGSATKSLDPYLVLNAEARQALNDQLSLTLAGKNLLNQVYQSVDGYVMPPLSFWVGADLRL